MFNYKNNHGDDSGGNDIPEIDYPGNPLATEPIIVEVSDLPECDELSQECTSQELI